MTHNWQTNRTDWNSSGLSLSTQISQCSRRTVEVETTRPLKLTSGVASGGRILTDGLDRTFGFGRAAGGGSKQFSGSGETRQFVSRDRDLLTAVLFIFDKNFEIFETFSTVSIG